MTPTATARISEGKPGSVGKQPSSKVDGGEKAMTEVSVTKRAGNFRKWNRRPESLF